MPDPSHTTTGPIPGDASQRLIPPSVSASRESVSVSFVWVADTLIAEVISSGISGGVLTVGMVSGAALIQSKVHEDLFAS